jgi:hypothetical protein
MAEVIPGFTSRFDGEHVLAAIAPRRFLAVSGTDDKYSADAHDVVELARAAFRARGDPGALSHIRVVGGHALEAQRFESIVNWLVRAGTTSESTTAPQSGREAI